MPSISGASLKGRWEFQLREQTIRLPSGDVLETIRQEPLETSDRFLTVTDHELTTTHEYSPDAAAALGRRYYEVTRAYYREDDSIFVTAVPGTAPLPQLIQQLDDHRLTLLIILTSAADWPVTEVAMHYTRQE